jgi:hypothetical protein
MRAVAMKLHTREQAPKEGKVEAPKQTVRTFQRTHGVLETAVTKPAAIW